VDACAGGPLIEGDKYTSNAAAIGPEMVRGRLDENVLWRTGVASVVALAPASAPAPLLSGAGLLAVLGCGEDRNWAACMDDWGEKTAEELGPEVLPCTAPLLAATARLPCCC
jgi:hypothetical protein